MHENCQPVKFQIWQESHQDFIVLITIITIYSPFIMFFIIDLCYHCMLRRKILTFPYTVVDLLQRVTGEKMHN